MPHLPSPPPIAFCITDLDAGGAEKALCQLALGLKQEQFLPRVYCLGPEAELANVLRAGDVEVHSYGANSWRDVFGATRWLMQHLRSAPPQILQSYLFHANIIGRYAGWRTRVPVIVAGHRVAERQQSWHVTLDRLTKRLVHEHVVVSQGVAAFVRERLRIPAEHCHIIPNGVHPSKKSQLGNIRDIFEIPPTVPLLIAVGRLHPQKGYLDLLQAAHLLQSTQTDFHLLIAGEGPQRRELLQQIRALKLTQKVTLAGYFPNARELMQQADLFVLTSHWEGLPNVLLEAMAEGCPVLATDVEGVRDVVYNHRSIPWGTETAARLAVIVEPHNPQQLAENIRHLLAHPELRREMSERAQRYVAENFTWSSVVQRYADLYKRLLQERVDTGEKLRSRQRAIS